MTPKEDQQPMTTREELVALADNLDTYAKRYSGDWANALPSMSWSRLEMIVNALRLASRQEVSVEELARVIDPIAFDIKPSMYGLRSQQELERHVFVSGVRGVARDKACALLAKYSITKRTTEG